MASPDRLAIAILRSRATDLAVVAADLRTNGLDPHNTEWQARQLEFNAQQLEEGKPMTKLQV